MMVQETMVIAQGAAAAPRIRAAEYIRMSTEHQQYSTDNQSLAINLYANERGFEIVRTYSDEGRSGLKLKGRHALQQLLADVESGAADYDAILIYDVSRLGRFQDNDEAAFCELTCRRAGIALHYCAEQFENDGSIGSSILKAVKRAMASEYSRELSVKVFAGQANLARRGYRLGGVAGYGLRRLLIDMNGVAKGELRYGEWKSISTDRIILVPGPASERAVIQEIFHLFVYAGNSEGEIAALLNARNLVTDLGRSWTKAVVRKILTNEKYIGNNVWGQTSFKLHGRILRTPPADWVRANGVFESLVDPDLFARAGILVAARYARTTNDEMLDQLRSLLAVNGYLTSKLIDGDAGLPISCTYRERFGSLLKAYALIGYKVRRDYSFLQDTARLRKLQQDILSDVVAGMEAVGAHVARQPPGNMLTINAEFTASVVLGRCYSNEAGTHCWKVRLDRKPRPDLIILARLDGQNARIEDYYLLPSLDMRSAELRLFRINTSLLDSYRSVTLEPLFRLVSRSVVRKAA